VIASDVRITSCGLQKADVLLLRTKHIAMAPILHRRIAVTRLPVCRASSQKSDYSQPRGNFRQGLRSADSRPQALRIILRYSPTIKNSGVSPPRPV
jgi:hypothetical protein